MQQLVCNLRFLRAQLHLLEESKSIFYRESTKLTDIASTYLDLPRFQPQPRPVAVRAQRISAITAQKDADVQLIFLVLQMIEESTNSQKLPLAVENQVSVFRLEVHPRYIERNPRLFGIAFQVRKKRTVLRLGPRLNGAIGQGLNPVWNDQIEIEVDRVPKSLAPRTRSVRIVEGEKPRFRLLITQVAFLALEPLRETQSTYGVGGVTVAGRFKNTLARFAIGSLNRVHHAGASLNRNNQPIDQHEH